MRIHISLLNFIYLTDCKVACVLTEGCFYITRNSRKNMHKCNYISIFLWHIENQYLLVRDEVPEASTCYMFYLLRNKHVKNRDRK